MLLVLGPVLTPNILVTLLQAYCETHLADAETSTIAACSNKQKHITKVISDTLNRGELVVIPNVSRSSGLI